MLGFLPDLIVLGLKIVGYTAAAIAVLFLGAAIVLVLWIKSDPPEKWSGGDGGDESS